MADRVLRGSRLGAVSYETDRNHDLAPRQIARYRTDNGEEFEVPFADDAEIPGTWLCRNGMEGTLIEGDLPEPKKVKPPRTHWDMLLVAALNMRGRGDTASIEGAYHAVHDTLGATIAVLFAVGLLASGLASSSVGAYAGAMIMQGLLHWSVPMLVRRLITLGPALAILTLGFDPTRTLVLSQVVLSFGIPFAVLPLVKLTGSPAVMGGDTNHRATTWVG